MSDLVFDGIKRLESELKIPWLPNTSVSPDKKLIFWTHPFFLLAQESARPGDNIGDVIENMRENIISSYTCNEDVVLATSESFDAYQLRREYDVFCDLLSKPSNHICFALGIDEAVFVDAKKMKRSPLQFYTANAARVFASHLNMESKTSGADISFILTTDFQGNLKHDLGNLRRSITNYTGAVNLQHEAVLSLRKMHALRLGSYAEYCARGTRNDLRDMGFNTTFMREGSVFNSLTFTFKYGSLLRQYEETFDVGAQFDEMLIGTGLALHKDLCLNLASRDFVPFGNSANINYNYVNRIKKGQIAIPSSLKLVESNQ